MSRYKVGDRFCRLLILGIIGDAKNPRAECKCDCGAIATPQLGALGSGRAKSCGCLRREKLKAANLVHGMSGTKEYKAWASMRARCTNARSKEWKNYGGRGIKCLYETFNKFIEDVGRSPPGSELDRIDNDGNYEPGNCRWVTPAENLANKRCSKRWVINGISYETSTSAARALGVTPSVIVRGCNGFIRRGRVFSPRAGWSCELKYPSSAPLSSVPVPDIEHNPFATDLTATLQLSSMDSADDNPESQPMEGIA